MRTKVAEFCHAIAIDDDVLRLDVAVDDAAGVEVSDGMAKRQHHLDWVSRSSFSFRHERNAQGKRSQFVYDDKRCVRAIQAGGVA